MAHKTEFGDYDSMYGALDYGGAVVLDIGADYGSTAEYFLGLGAARVIVSERREDWVDRLRQWAAKDDRVVLEETLSPENAERMLLEHGPDVVKVDCERCERFLLDVPDAALGLPRAWVMETHTRELFDAFTALFRRLGYEVTVVEEFAANPPERCIKVIKATR